MRIAIKSVVVLGWASKVLATAEISFPCGVIAVRKDVCPRTQAQSTWLASPATDKTLVCLTPFAASTSEAGKQLLLGTGVEHDRLLDIVLLSIFVLLVFVAIAFSRGIFCLHVVHPAI